MENNYVSDCSSEKNLIIVAAKNVPSLSEMTEKDERVIKYTGLLFDIWDEIARINNLKQVFTFKQKNIYNLI